MSGATDSVLERIVRRRRADIAAAYGGLARVELERLAAGGRDPRAFAAALTAGENVAVIAEVKKASPSAGPIAQDVAAAAQALHYQRGGATAISVLVEPSEFGGTFADLSDVADAVDVPVLCKDFVVDEVQAYVARSCGADALLLMVSVLGGDVGRYLGLVRRIGMEALVEVVSRAELVTALEAGASLVAVNARDLHSLRVDPEAARRLVAEAAAAGVTVVLASGVKTRADVESAAAAGADAVLVGEILMRAESPTRAVAELTGVSRAARATMAEPGGVGREAAS